MAPPVVTATPDIIRNNTSTATITNDTVHAPLIPAKTKVLVIGGGPAGSVAASLLCRQGIEVVLFEGDLMPRYHIGESLVISVHHVLKCAGVMDKINNAGFVVKHGATLKWGTQRWDLDFGDLPLVQKHSYQVVRSRFDKILLDHAAEQGCQVFQQVKVDKLEFDVSGRPVAATYTRTSDSMSGKIEFDHLVDASGRRGIMSTTYLKNRHNHEVFQNMAIWGYWKNVSEVKGREGTTLTCSLPNGWVWGIPLDDGTYSVGVVMLKDEFFRLKNEEKLDLKTIYMNALQGNSLVQEVLVEPATLVTEVKFATDYSYAADKFSGPGYYIVGDAACFLDPLFSTGVHLATMGAFMAAASIGSVIRKEVSENEAVGFYENSYRRVYTRLLEMVSFFYASIDMKTYFFKAQELIKEENNPEKSQLAFTKLVSGFSDVFDSSNGKDFYGKVNAKGYEEMPNSMKNPVNGMFISTEPHLKLTRVNTQCC